MSLASTFDTAKPRDPNDLAGAYAVRLATACLPPIRVLGHTKVFERSTSSAITGHNEFLGGLVKAGRFRVARGAAADGADVTQIIYDTPKNPRFMRGLTDEVRETAPGHFLGRGMLKVAGRARNVFWFTVTKE